MFTLLDQVLTFIDFNSETLHRTAGLKKCHCSLISVCTSKGLGWVKSHHVFRGVGGHQYSPVFNVSSTMQLFWIARSIARCLSLKASGIDWSQGYGEILLCFHDQFNCAAQQLVLCNLRPYPFSDLGILLLLFVSHSLTLTNSTY